MVSSRRSSGIPPDSLESEDASGTPEAADDPSFQLLDLVHEEEDTEVAAAAISCKVSTAPESSSGILWTDSAQSQHTVKDGTRGLTSEMDDPSSLIATIFRLGYPLNKYLLSAHSVPGMVLRFCGYSNEDPAFR